jgi:ribonucleoside-diphosphate reductase alpha chain
MALKKGIALMADYVFLSKYAQKKEDGSLETWSDTVQRIYSMHEKKLKSMNKYTEKVQMTLKKAQHSEEGKLLLSSQRARQFASPNENSGILKHETKIYNCTGTLVDRPKVFSEVMYLLLSGCGVGYSLHKPFVEKLPEVQKLNPLNVKNFIIPDSIEGWADSVDVLINARFNGQEAEFDYSQIRPEGALIDNKFIAPGPEPLKKAHQNIKSVFSAAQGRKLKTIELHDILCFIAEAVVSGGVRRSAMISLFDRDDEDMLKAKTGSWWKENPQRAMANNSIISTFDEPFSYSQLKDLIQVVRQFGEPGFVRLPSYDYCVNPCGEIMLHPVTDDGRTGFAFCNLVEINAEKITSVEQFYELCEQASAVATVQALYTNFKYLSSETREIAERDRAIGVSLTGIIANPLLRGNVLRKGAEIIKKTNREFAEIFGINHSKACTTIKPSGNASALLELFHSGIHPAHARKFFRRIRIKTYSPEYKALEGTPMVHFLRNDEAYIEFPCKTTSKTAITKDEISAVEHLKFIAEVKHFWINKGADSWALANNVSATVETADDEWDQAIAVLFANDHLFGGVSFLPKLGDTIYEAAPFQRVSTPELEKHFEELEEFIYTHDVDFHKILQGTITKAGDLAAIGCAGGQCELQ